MIEIHDINLNYPQLIELIASKLHTKPSGNSLQIPAYYGTGFMWAETFEDDFSVFVIQATFKEGLRLQRSSGESTHLILQFMEMGGESETREREASAGTSDDLVKNGVSLTNTFIATKLEFPPGKSVHSVNILFSRKFLLDFLDPSLTDKILSSYFSGLFKNPNIEPVDAAYRQLMHELLVEKFELPLKHQVIRNRAMLLLERFMRKSARKSATDQQYSKISEDEIIRLMRAEALLVKDFNKEAPGIATLSRLCAMSPTKLKKDFKALYGLPVYEYYQKNRMLHARTLLLTRKYTIAEVGYLVGYTNLGHFAANFKKEFGMLPRQLTSMEKKSGKSTHTLS